MRLCNRWIHHFKALKPYIGEGSDRDVVVKPIMAALAKPDFDAGFSTFVELLLPQKAGRSNRGPTSQQLQSVIRKRCKLEELKKKMLWTT